LRVEAVHSSPYDFRVARHCRDDSLAGFARAVVKFRWGRNQTGIHQSHGFHCYSKGRNAATIDSNGDVLKGNSGKLRNRATDDKLNRIVRTVIRVHRRADMQCDRQHTHMFAGTVVMQDIRLFSFLAQPTRDFRTEGFVGATLQDRWLKPDLLEHLRSSLSVNLLSAV